VSRFFSEVLGKHNRTAFTSGNDRIDAYFRQTVSQDIKRNYAVCYVLVEKDTAKIAGLYTLSSHSVPLTEIAEDIARKLPRYPSMPAVLIGWLGRDVSFRGQDVGSMLLYDAIARVASAPIGAHAICADAVDDKAKAFYQAHLFQSFPSRPASLFLPMKTAEKLISE
jgi:ribosomal protein S18 acetylase RimI-like enzyme